MVKRIQTGIYFQEKIFETIFEYVDSMNEYIESFLIDEEKIELFAKKYGYKPKKVKLVDFTDYIIYEYLYNDVVSKSFLETAKRFDYSKKELNRYDKEYFSDLQEIGGSYLDVVYEGLNILAILYNKRGTRGLYINENYLEDFRFASKYFIGENFGDKATFLNLIFKHWFISNKIASPSYFIPNFWNQLDTFQMNMESYEKYLKNCKTDS